MHVPLDPARAHLDPLANLGLRPSLAGLGLGPRAFSHADLHHMSNAHAELNPYASQTDIAGLAAQASSCPMPLTASPSMQATEVALLQRVTDACHADARANKSPAIAKP